MAKVKQGRWTAEIEGDFVVFLIGARPNSFFHLVRSFFDLGGRRGMNHMLKYLSEHPEKGLLGYQDGFPVIVQYWRSFEHLRRSPAIGTTRTSSRGATTGSGWASPTAPGSGARPTSSALGSTRRSTATCRPSVLAKATRLIPASESSTARLRVRQGAGASA